jgi:hypothetical protein
MTRLDLDPDLQRLGDALRASTTSDLVRERQAARAERSEPGRARRSRPRVLAGSTLGLAGVGAALLLVLGGSAAPPALAVTRQHDGSVLVRVNVDVKQAWVAGADRKLASMGIDEQIMANYEPGTAPASGPVTCTPLGGANTPAGPPVKVLLGSDGTQAIPSGTTGAGSTVHISSCVYYKTPTPGGGNTGNTGAS